MSRSPLRETVALTRGTEAQSGQHARLPMEIELAKDTKPNTGTLHLTIQYRARQDRDIEIPLDRNELRRLHDLTGSLLNQ